MLLQVLLSWDYYIQWAFTYLTLTLLFYKVYAFTFPARLFTAEVIILVILQLIQFLRIFIGSKGNKLEQSGTTSVFILLIFPSIIGGLYFIALQTYTLLLETLVGGLIIVLSLIEFIFACFAILDFKTLQNAAQ